MNPAFTPLLALSPVLAATIWFDLRYMRIPNWLVALAVGIGAVALLMTFPINAVLWQVGLALGVFALGFLGFVFRILGGGDVKMLAAVMLAVPFGAASLYMVLMSVSMLLAIGALQLLPKLPAGAGATWAVLRERRSFPMGLSIGLAGLLLPWVARAL